MAQDTPAKVKYGNGVCSGFGRSDVPVALPSINPEYDSSLDAAIPTARVVVREEKKTILLPDFSQKIITNRHMDDGTVDIFTQPHHTEFLFDSMIRFDQVAAARVLTR